MLRDHEFELRSRELIAGWLGQYLTGAAVSVGGEVVTLPVLAPGRLLFDAEAWPGQLNGVYVRVVLLAARSQDCIGEGDSLATPGTGGGWTTHEVQVQVWVRATTPGDGVGTANSKAMEMMGAIRRLMGSPDTLAELHRAGLHGFQTRAGNPIPDENHVTWLMGARCKWRVRRH